MTQQVPYRSGADNRPDLRYGSEVLAGSTFTGGRGINFSLQDDVNFRQVHQETMLNLVFIKLQVVSP